MHEYGIDIGSVSIKLAEFSNGRLVQTRYIKHQGQPYNLLLSILKSAEKIDRLVMTGSLVEPLTDLLGAVRINEVEATAAAIMHFHPEVRSIIEIGGEDSKLINVNGGIRDFASNTICAAGTGIFLDQQARRLCYDIDDLGDVALRAKKPARIAGRCSVFAKSDMIHLQQIGTAPDDLIAGLCLALARNFKSVIAKGREIETPVAFVGGVAANKGMIKAFHETLQISPGQLLVPKHHNSVGAIGAVLAARKSNLQSTYRGHDKLAEWLALPKIVKRLPPLDGKMRRPPTLSSTIPAQKTTAYLGIDVGSISTNLVLIDEEGNVLGRKYLWTRGRPIEVVLEGLAELSSEIGDKVDIAGAGTTGSGRYLIGEFIGADIIKNEITAQARAAFEIDPMVDTIFEIGGQDSKFISLRNRTIVDFEMNKVCAAGTGSFLEEQAEILGVELKEFGDLALQAKSPINLGERCTVFINSEVIHQQKDTQERENLLAGLGYSIVYNYLNRVVSGKEIGKKIFFQGGVAANKSVVSAFEEVLQKEIVVPPNYDVTGAIGIALIVRDSSIKRTKFRGLNLASKSYTSISFTCKDCSNACEINEIAIAGEEIIHYGGRCGKYEEKEKKNDKVIPDLFKLRNDIFFRTEQTTGPEIGVPRCLIMYELFPFFYEFLKQLGFNPVLSEPTTRKVIEYGSELALADTCLPVKVALGQIQSLLGKGIDRLFIPSVITMQPQDEIFPRSYVCPYVQALPYLTRAVFGEEVVVHAPYLHFDRGQAGVEESLVQFGKDVGKTKKEVKRAIEKALNHWVNIQNEIKKLGRDVMEQIEHTAFVVCSRPYNGFDVGMNLNLPKKLRDLGVLAIPLDFLDLDYKSIKTDFSNMYWHYGQRIMSAAELIRKDERLFPVYLSNFACGPDSFLTRFFREKLGAKPFLLLEIDEHSGDAGFITRCEAFLDSIRGASRSGAPRKINQRSEVKEGRTIYVPYMCDGARVLAGAMKRAGIDAEVLPKPDEESISIGRQYTSGRECIPAIITAGDMVKKINSPDFDPQSSGFFMAQGSGPCRFGQYYRLHRIILDELGHGDIPIYAPNQGPSLFDDLGTMGITFLTSAWDGVCAVDALEARAREIRPYEAHAGRTEEIYNRYLDDLCMLIERGKSIVPLIREARKDFDAIRVDRIDKPKIGIVGEIYVRSQEFSNNFVIRRLEGLGCEIALPSIGEWFLYLNFTRVRNCRWFRQYRRVIFTKIFDRYMKHRQKKIFGILGLQPEASVHKLFDHASSYMHSTLEGEAVMTIGKTIDFIKEGFDGVVNVMPFTCMPGNTVTSIYKKIKDDYRDFPLFNLSVDGLDHAVDTMRLETFVAQARTHQRVVTLTTS
ncbi:MAG: acyl-CoA dehydratase activase [candidate division WOR-3 bacterium]|nr:acyl-CoA dehydratase activase [candidate division WOR-3 bacterium]